MGVAVAIVAWWIRAYLMAQVEALDVEMECVSRGMMNELA